MDSSAESVEYHCSDFDLDLWALEAAERFRLPAIRPDPWIGNDVTVPAKDDENELIRDETSTQASNGNEENSSQLDHWDKFYDSHQAGSVYKPRRYIYVEFQGFFQKVVEANTENVQIFEVGCAHGCTILPLLGALPNRVQFIASDLSDRAINILKNHPIFDNDRISTCQYDLCMPPLSQFIESSHFILATFVISAIHPSFHDVCFRHLSQICRRGGYILFRDYAEHDMTMYRHTVRYGPRLFRRGDGTLAYYFTKEDIYELAAANDFVVEEIYYATVQNVNRKTKSSMNRVFLHAVLKKNE